MARQREHWGSRLGFIMATAGSAIGLGSLWKFPYVTGDNGGGLFVLVYVLFTFIVGVPIFMAELLLGRGSQLSPVGTFTSWAHNRPRWKLLGWTSVLASFIIISYYCVVAGWAVNYTLMSINQFMDGREPGQIRELFDILYRSGDVNVLWFGLFLLMTIGVVYGGIRKGIEYWAKILTPALLILLVALFIYGTTLDGFGEAFRFVFYPDASKLSPSGILKALGLSFFTLSVGMGILITYGSYMKSSESLPGTACIVASMTVGVSLLSALMIFPIIFSFGFSPELGPGLLFKTMPVLFAKMPGALVLSSAFFILVVFTALTSSISILEVLVATLMELKAWSRRKAIVICGCALFVFGLPSALAGSGDLFASWSQIFGKNFFDTMDQLCDTWLLPLNGLLVAVFAGWAVDAERRRTEFSKGTTSYWFYRPWLFSVRWIVPIAILLVILNQTGIINIDLLWNKL